MQGGITAWMQADYKIYTTYHHVNVDSTNGRTTVDIEPWLLFKTNCSSCQSQEQPNLIQSIQTNETVIEASENHSVLLITEEINGTIHEYTLDRTVLWRYNETADGLNRTINFLSAIITEENNSTQLFGLYDTVEHEEYNLTIGTILYPIDSQTYNLSLTKIEYTPTGVETISTIEQVDFNGSVTLSQLYKNLGKAIDKLAKNYEKSEDPRLVVFAERYNTMADETRFLSRVVRSELTEYNGNILNNIAVIEDDFLCDWCPIWCPSILIIGCAIACFFTATTGCYFCAMYGSFLSMGCDAACLAVCAAEEGDDYPSYVSSITYTGGYGSYAVNNPNNLIGPNSDSASVHLHASNYGDTAQIIGELNTVSSGDIYIYGCSGSGGYYSDLYVYVSYDYNNWNLVSVQTITATSPYSIYIGEASNFRYISIAGYDSANSVCLYLDAVRVNS